MADDDASPSDAEGHGEPSGARQTPQQAAITRQGGEGRTDAQRAAAWPNEDGGAQADHKPGLGGSSQGTSDRKPSDV